ncbi:MAG: GTPase ObgE [Deltaproteobacteria bacterium]|nr:GTPase ObgE [Deltaproteobacteria bacterium]NIS77549.1 GTPase ObgE [Deltaproteobacteria bacterium]
MHFVDEALIRVRSGKGGNGCISFRREKFVPRGGPDGGNGGRGGHVILKPSKHLSTLLDYKYKKAYVAKRGQHGRGKKQHGKQGADLILQVPEGTLIRDGETGAVLADLAAADTQYTVTLGGKGGRGNAHFATSTNQAPDYAESGGEGEEKVLKLELLVIASVGIVGKPNAGKSTLIRKISRARPKVAAYPFTTLAPVLGVVRYKDFGEFVVAEIPGIIEGASTGAGLGTRFLKHLQRTKIIIVIIDASGGTEAIRGDTEVITGELEQYDPSMQERTLLILLNKIDLPEARENAKFALDNIGFPRENVMMISAATGEGVEQLLKRLTEVIGNERKK